MKFRYRLPSFDKIKPKWKHCQGNSFADIIKRLPKLYPTLNNFSGLEKTYMVFAILREMEVWVIDEDMWCHAYYIYEGEGGYFINDMNRKRWM